MTSAEVSTNFPRWLEWSSYPNCISMQNFESQLWQKKLCFTFFVWDAKNGRSLIFNLWNNKSPFPKGFIKDVGQNIRQQLRVMISHVTLMTTISRYVSLAMHVGSRLARDKWRFTSWIPLVVTRQLGSQGLLCILEGSPKSHPIATSQMQAMKTPPFSDLNIFVFPKTHPHNFIQNIHDDMECT